MRLPADLMWTTNDYVWYKDGELLPKGDKVSELKFENLNDKNPSSYQCVVSNAGLPGFRLTSAPYTLHLKELSDDEFKDMQEQLETSRHKIQEKESDFTFSGKVVPDGNSSHNVFRVTTCNEHLNMENSTLQVFNANGQLVYSATPYKNNWRGEQSNGATLPAGAYFYRFLKNKDMDKAETGTVILIR